MDKTDSRTLPVEAFSQCRRRAVKMRLDGVPLREVMMGRNTHTTVIA